MLTENENGYSVIDLSKLLQSLWKYKIVIAVVVVLAALVGGIKVKYFTQDRYTTSLVLYISNRDNGGESVAITNDVRTADITASRIFSTTCTEILKTRSFFEDVAEKSGTDYTATQISRMVGVSNVNETELISVGVRTNSAEDTYKIACGIAAAAPEKLKAIAEGGSVIVIDEPIVPQFPDSKNLVRNVIIYMFAAAVVSVGILFVVTLFDKKVHKAEDVAKRYNISILGEISK